MKHHVLKLLFVGALAGGSHRALAQEGVWPAVPALLGGGGPHEIVLAIHRRLVYPPEARMACFTGRVFVAFAITPSGGVRRVRVVKSLWPPFDSAAVRAVRQLRFQLRPLQAGAVPYVVPINYQIYEDTQAAKKALRCRQKNKSSSR
jgi:TonB family protein